MLCVGIPTLPSCALHRCVWNITSKIVVNVGIQLNLLGTKQRSVIVVECKRVARYSIVEIDI